MALVHQGNVRVIDAHSGATYGPELEVSTIDRRAVIDAGEVLDLRDALTDWLQAVGRDHPNPGGDR